MPHRTRHWLWILPLLLLIMGLGARDLTSDGLWYDEQWSIYDSGGAHYGPLSPAEIWTRIANEDPTQPPGYPMLLSVWGTVAGWSEFSGRALSLLFGVLAVAAMYRLGTDLGGRPAVGLAAAVALSAGAFFIYYLHELRGFTLYVFLTIICALCYWRLISRSGPGPLWMHALLVASIVGMLYTHYFSALTPAAIGVYHAIFVRRKWRILVLMGLAGLTFVPWLAVLFYTMRFIGNSFRYPNANFFDVAQNILGIFSSGSVGALIVLALLSLRKPTRSVWFAWVWLLVWFGLAWVVITRLSVFELRYMIGLWPALALLVGLGIVRIGIPAAPVIALWLLAGILSLGNAPLRGLFHRDIYHQPIREAINALNGHVRAGDFVTYHLLYDLEAWTHERVFEYYLHRLHVPGAVIDAPRPVTDDEYSQRAASKVQGVSRVWITYNRWLPPEKLNLFEGTLRNNGFERCIPTQPLANLDPNVVSVDLFAAIKPGQDGAPLRFGTGIEQRLANPLEAISNQPGDLLVLPVVLRTTMAGDIPRGTYSTGLHILNGDGRLVAQADYGLGEGCQTTDIALNGLPPGDYTVYAIVYNWQTGERLPPSGENSSSEGRVLLGKFSLDASNAPVSARLR